MVKQIITWDLGATKCAAAVVEYDHEARSFFCKNKYSVKLKTCQTLEELVHQLEQGLTLSMRDADAICIGAAGSYDGEKIHHTIGYPYEMNIADIAKKHAWPVYDVIHDYSPIVCATFTSYMNDPDSVKRLNSCSMNPLGRRVALGVGTGLGVKDGILFPDGNFWLGQNEFGHAGIPMPPHARIDYQKQHMELTRFFRNELKLGVNEPLTFEKILSGKGIVRLYRFFYPEDKEGEHPENIIDKMSIGQMNEVRALFAWYLGLFVGTVQLAFMPEGGIWITGGVVLNHLDLFKYPEFFHGLEASPAYLEKRHSFPLGVMCNPEHAFMGGAYYAVKRLIHSNA